MAPLRASSTPQGRKPAQPATASSTMRRRWGAGVIPSASLCGGTAAGTKRISSSPSASRTSSAARRCPRWIGSKVPPRMPMPPLRCSVPDLAVAAHHVLVGRELAQPHRAARVQPVRADPDLGAEAELVPVGEARSRRSRTPRRSRPRRGSAAAAPLVASVTIASASCEPCGR